MEKKEYMTPVMEAMDIAPVEMIAASVKISDEVTEADADMAGGRRGTWGNIWE